MAEEFGIMFGYHARIIRKQNDLNLVVIRIRIILLLKEYKHTNTRMINMAIIPLLKWARMHTWLRESIQLTFQFLNVADRYSHISIFLCI